MTAATRARPLLSRGDTVGIVAPGFAPAPSRLQAGIRALARAGYRVRVGEHVRGLHGYFPAEDRRRAEDFIAMVRDPEVAAVWFARGGYGSSRLLPHIDWEEVRRCRKPFIGYSDVTALGLAAAGSPGPVWLYGPVVTELGVDGSYSRPGLRRLLRGEADCLRFRPGQVLVPGAARGVLRGGNLTVLAHMLGTRWMPSLDGAILALEDVGEETYRLDRLLTHLRLSGVLDRLSGICLGRFDPPPARRRFPPDVALRDLLRDLLGDLPVPVVAGLPFGHVRNKRTLPLGGAAVLDTARLTLEIAPGSRR